MGNEIIDFIILLILILLVVVVFGLVSTKVRKGGGAFSSLMYGATDQFYDKDKRAAIQHMEEEKAQKMEEQSSEESKEKGKLKKPPEGGFRSY